MVDLNKRVQNYREYTIIFLGQCDHAFDTALQHSHSLLLRCYNCKRSRSPSGECGGAKSSLEGDAEEWGVKGLGKPCRRAEHDAGWWWWPDDCWRSHGAGELNWCRFRGEKIKWWDFWWVVFFIGLFCFLVCPDSGSTQFVGFMFNFEPDSG